MKRLILLGNGFDLAHGMQTSYNDFIVWYLVSSMETAAQEGVYTDGIISIHKNGGELIHSYVKTIEEFVKFFYRKGSLQPLLGTDRISYDNNRVHYQNPFKVIVHSEFMKLLFSDCSILNWVDIENKYYSALKEVLTLKSLKTNDKEVLAQLNKTMEVITKNLEVFLKKQKPRNISYGYDTIINHPIQEKEFVHWNKVESQELEETVILNFNYTDTIESYRTSENDVAYPCKVNYIHGRLSSSKNPLIFGFGDELDESYKKIEDHPTKGFFKHIKSFGYFKTRNYHDLIRYIESGQYQVFILGHSCGLSDRTMLNMIFEHDNCMSIKIYYYQIDQQRNNYTELTEEISRHFKSKIKMRERIVSLEYCQSMPQVD